MGKKIERNRSKTLPSSPTHSSSSYSSDFEFRISLSPRKSSAVLCPADELFYKGQILPLHPSPRISMVRTLLESSSTPSSSNTTTTASRDSSSSNDSVSSSFASDLSLLAAGEPCCNSSRPSSAAEDDLLKRLSNKNSSTSSSTSSRHFFISRFSNVFKKDNVNAPIAKDNNNVGGSNVKKMSSTAKEVIKKYIKKVKPLYEKISAKQQVVRATCVGPTRTSSATLGLLKETERSSLEGTPSATFSNNLKGMKMIKRSYVASCPSSMRTSPSHSGVLNRNGMPVRTGAYGASTSQGSSSSSSETSTMEELQNAIQGAIAHCKISMLQNSNSSFNNNKVSKKCKAFEI